MHFPVVAVSLFNFCVFALAEDVKSVLEGLGVKGKKDALSFKVYDQDFKATLTDIEYEGFSDHDDALLSLHVTKTGSTDAGRDVKLVTHYKASNNELTSADRTPYKDDKRDTVKAMYAEHMAISAPDGLLQACSKKGPSHDARPHRLANAIRGAISTFKILPVLEAKKLLGKPKGLTVRLFNTAGQFQATIKDFGVEYVPIGCVLITAQLFNAAGKSFEVYRDQKKFVMGGGDNAFVRVLVQLTASNKLELAKPPTSSAPTDFYTDEVPLTVLARIKEDEEKFWKFYLDTTPKPDSKNGRIYTPRSWKINATERRVIAEAFVAALNDAAP